mgnify:FL=1
MQTELDLRHGIVIFGDSELTINFMIRSARASKPQLATLVRKIQQERKNVRCRIIYSHVPRAQNAVADWLARVGLALKKTCSIQKLGAHTLPGGPAP